jgi:hypothetical protein
MIIFDFISQEEIDDLPDDDPHAAFISFVRIAQRRLGERTALVDATDSDSWAELEEARHGFMNVVIAAAKKYEIEPFASLSVPRLDQFDTKIHRQFKADLDHYMTQLLLDNSSRAKRDSVFISPDLKNDIRTYIHHLKEVIERSNDLGEAKRAALLQKLSEFEAELEKKRLSLMAVTLLTITILGAPGAIWASGEIATKLLTNILRVVGEAKITDDETRRLPSAAAPMAITGPRPNDPDLVAKSKNKTTRGDLDDEIPF